MKGSHLLKEAKEYILTWTKENRQEFYDIEHQIWAHPELPMQEHNSSRLLQELLAKYGFRIEKGIAHMPTAFIATYGSGKPVNQP